MRAPSSERRAGGTREVNSSRWWWQSCFASAGGGVARARARALGRKDPKGRRPLEDIWLVDEKALADLRASGVKVKMIRIDISPVLSRGVAWCRSRH